MLQNEFNTSHAFLIGINNYQYVSPLENAVNDVKAVAGLLAAAPHSYSVHPPLLDATKEDIESLVEKVMLKEVKKGDRVLFYFAGHGVALDQSEEGKPTGYLLPADVNRDDLSGAISMDWLLAQFSLLASHHFFLVLDCCFSGSFRWSNERMRGIAKLPATIFRERYDRFIKDQAWQVLTSSAADQRAIDLIDERPLGKRENFKQAHSPFAWYFMEGIKGEADLIPKGRPNGLITATELYVYIREQVEKETMSLGDDLRQTPSFFALDKHDKGEYLFLSLACPLNLPHYDPNKNPFRGLLPYEQKDQELFFGRDRVITDLVDRCEQQNLVLVSGASGTGKSSLLNAGVIPRFTDAGCEIISMRPGEKPGSRLSALLQRTRTDQYSTKLVLVIDQLEELFTICQNPDERSVFWASLQGSLKGNYNLLFLLAIRSDFEPLLEDQFPKFDWANHRFVVPGFRPEELREVILQPCLRQVLYFDPPHLVDKLANEVLQSPGGLPLLSFTLSGLFQEYVRDGMPENRALTLEYYKRIGGVSGSLKKQITTIYDNLSEPQQRVLRDVLLRMVSLQGAEPTRRAVSLDELDYEEGEKNQQVQQVLLQLELARLVVRDRTDEGVVFIEPAHDTLLTVWGKLWEWITAYRLDFSLRDNLINRLREYQEEEKPTSLLLVADNRLEYLEGLLHEPDKCWLNKQEADFVRTSYRSHQQLKRRRKLTIIGVITILTLLSLFAVFNARLARIGQEEAEKQTAIAKGQTKIAEDKTAEVVELSDSVSIKNAELRVEALRAKRLEESLTDDDIYQFLAAAGGQAFAEGKYREALVYLANARFFVDTNQTRLVPLVNKKVELTQRAADAEQKFRDGYLEEADRAFAGISRTASGLNTAHATLRREHIKTSLAVWDAAVEGQRLDTISSIVIEGNLVSLPYEVQQLEMLTDLTFQNSNTIELYINSLPFIVDSITFIGLNIYQLPSHLWNIKGLQTLKIESLTQLARLPKELCSLVSLRSLAIHHNSRLAKLLVSWQGLGSLTSLEISDNDNLDNLPSWTGLNSLTSLEVSSNFKLNSLPSWIGLSSLASLEISSNFKLNSLPSWIGLSSLTSLEIRSNSSLKSLPSWEGLSSLTSLEISDNDYLTKLPVSWQGLGSLTNLEIRSNPSLYIIRSWEGLTSLTSLEISDNDNLDNLSSWTGLNSLTFLEISSNFNLTSLPSWIGLNSLTNLEVSDNDYLTKLPASWQGLGSLTNLEIRSNPSLYIIRSWEGLTSLTSLEISDNDDLTKLPLSWRGLGSLTSLEISGNNNYNLSIPSWEGLNSLTSLEIRSNRSLKSLPSWIGLNSLTSLEISDNRYLTELPLSWRGLGSLTSLEMYDNDKLDSIPSWLGLNNLTSLEIRSNHSLKSLPSWLGLNKLTSLEITSNPSLDSLRSWEGLSSLTFLEISSNFNLTSLPSWEGLSSLTSLWISGNGDLVNLPAWSGLSTLKRVLFSGPRELESLSEIEDWTTLPSLHKIVIRGSDSLTVIPIGLSQLSNLDSLYLMNLPALTKLSPKLEAFIGQLQYLHVYNTRIPPKTIVRWKERFPVVDIRTERPNYSWF